MSEIPLKLQRIRQFLSEHNLSAVLLGNQNSFSWITGGGDAHVVLAGDGAVGSILVTPHKAFLLTNTIEKSRLYTEEISARTFEPLIFPWQDGKQELLLLKKIAGQGRVASDHGMLGTRHLGAALARLRWQLLPGEIKRYREVGALASEALELTARAIRPGMSEHEIAARLASAVMSREAIPHVVLIATDDRIRRFRHPIPTKARLRRHAMLVICAKKYGLIASATRLVHFGKLPRDLRKRHDAVCLVDCAFNLATRPGVRASEVFRKGVNAYRECGFAGEWRRHHQGGATGYAGRDWVGTPHCAETVLENQAFAWNPSIAGAKSEDTVLVTRKGLEILTQTGPKWPMVHFHHPNGCVERPDILVR